MTTADDFADLTPAQFLKAVVSGAIYPYIEHRIPKRSGGLRALHAPVPRLSGMQQEILARLETLPAESQPHPAAFAYRGGRSVVDCAAVHLRAHTVIRLDIADFFGSIRERHVHAALKDAWTRPTEREYRIDLVRDNGRPEIGLRRTGRTLGTYTMVRLVTVSPPAPSETWTNRGTGYRNVYLEATGQSFDVRRPSLVHKHTREGFLPQGAPTSGYLSNIVMRGVDAVVTHQAESLGLRYTRYSDDLYFSSRALVHHDVVDRLVAGVKKALEPLGMRINTKKTYVARPGARRSVLGILVDGPVPRLTREYKRRITKHVRGAASFGVEQHRRHQNFKDLAALDAHVTGLLSFAHMVEPGWAEGQLTDWKRLREIPLKAEDPEIGQLGLDLPWEEEVEASQENLAKASIDDLVRGAQRYRSSSDYLRMLEFVGRFKRYAPFNAMVVHIQKPGARYVLSSSEWKSKYRRVLKPGAQPLLIFQPRGPYMLVYDVGDTEALPGALPLPKAITAPVSVSSRAEEKEVAEVWRHTETNLAPLGIRLTLVNHGATSCGRTYRSRQHGLVERPGSRPGDRPEAYPMLFEIEVNQNLPLLDRYATLAHELGHLFCGHLGAGPGGTWSDRYVKPSSDKEAEELHARNEVEAESIAYMVLKRLDPEVRMGDYITGHLGPTRQVPETVALNLTFKAAGLITDMGKKRIPASKLRRSKE
ncbi:reverse transcriptase domain-containing protein [Kitasatospora sp. NBC_00240]|uniref:RNA-directed DNA polymerase n=1 Tax=Kitasatospora sp. NBC_00240 TaxID=2903567 RepID=UPI002255348F|nr:RNA-directed DNA polymerase [Kitasatospora sp. NBC_00240]MCX5210082.1 reverse transcriptase domain-containing protein [Kitasatospora sp. NBC_00240]